MCLWIVECGGREIGVLSRGHELLILRVKSMFTFSLLQVAPTCHFWQSTDVQHVSDTDTDTHRTPVFERCLFFFLLLRHGSNMACLIKYHNYNRIPHGSDHHCEFVVVRSIPSFGSNFSPSQKPPPLVHVCFSHCQSLMLQTKQFGLFGLANSVTQFSVFITHNSKMVEPIAKRLFGKR